MKLKIKFMYTPFTQFINKLIHLICPLYNNNNNNNNSNELKFYLYILLILIYIFIYILKF